MKRIKPAFKCSIKPTQEECWKIATICMVLRDKIFPGVFKFVHKHNAIPAPVMIDALSSIAKNKPDDPWAYGTKILDIQTKNFYEARAIKEHGEIKKADAEVKAKAEAKEILDKIMDGGF